MEKTISVEERIRRAEEIYNRRNNENYKTATQRNIKRSNPIVKLVKRLIVCFLIYLGFYVYTNCNYIFSEQFLNKTQEILNKNRNLSEIYINIKQYVNDNIFKQTNSDDANSQEQNENITNVQQENTSEEIKNNDEDIGGAEQDQEVQETEMEKDAREIKEKINFITPVNGRISSTFGWRTPTTVTVPKYHTGLDIATTTGTVIKSATDGVVLLASSEGDYGNHYKIQVDDVILIYAHCSKLYLSEGDTVSQGQDIAEVGSTGNSTGPHLHFEVRRSDRLVDPQLILDI